MIKNSVNLQNHNFFFAATLEAITVLHIESTGGISFDFKRSA